jgi:CcmD family protein
MRLLRLLVLSAVLLAPSASSAQQPPTTPPPQPPPALEGFEPLSEVPPSEQIPAFRLVAIAYSIVWVVLIGYVWSVSQRLQKVERELTTLERKGS